MAPPPTPTSPARRPRFFNAYGGTLQGINAKVTTSAAALAAQAQADTAQGARARAALAALSVVTVDVSTVVAAQFSLYNEATGAGNITQNWINDRASFTAKLYEQLRRGGGIVPGTGNLRFFDAASNTEVLVGAGSERRKQYVFGGEGADSAMGQGFEDHLYGGAGADALNGVGGNDYLQGDADDALDGGAGDDTLAGGTGQDTYAFGANWGVDTVIDADGLGRIEVDGIVLTGGKQLSDSGNEWISDDGQWSYLLSSQGPGRKARCASVSPAPEIYLLEGISGCNLRLFSAREK